MTPPLYAVMGPTAAGKTALAIALAERLDGEIISCDSAAVFRGLNVGTAKPTADEQARVAHHLIDVISPATQWSAAEFADAADDVISRLHRAEKGAILCGGTGLWMRALVRGIFRAPPIDADVRRGVRTALRERGPVAMHTVLAEVDPEAAARIQPNDPQRIGRALEVFRQTGRPISALQAEHGFASQRYRLLGVAPDWPRAVLRERIAARTRWMYANGLLDETRACLAEGVPPDAPGLSIIGYRDAVAHLQGKISLAAAVEETITATRRYAKRQVNWFNHEPDVHWIDPHAGVDVVAERLHARAREV